MKQTFIEKNILPPLRQPSVILPLREMEVGDSILIEGRMRRHFYYQSRLHAPKRFISRTVKGNGERRIRIWRVA